MKYAHGILASAALIGSSIAAYIPSEPWTTLTPKEPAPSGASTDYSATFGISVVTITSSISSSTASPTTKAKRDVVNQITDGQIQKQSGSLVVPTTTSTAQVINQIGDGQIQHQTLSTAQVINQIGDGQIQHQTSTTTTIAPVTTAKVINQIGDGQIQHQTTSTTTAKVINQIGDGQIQHQTTSTGKVVSQIGDGQIQATATVSGVSQITDGQVQATSVSSPSSSLITKACLTENSLAMTLKGSELVDSHGRIGSIVANRQFQFDGPPPQAGAIYAAGWSVTPEGRLAIGSTEIFYQCLSGDFYNLYDESIGAQCVPVYLDLIDLVSC